jgi:hypothetical protein
MLKQSILSSRTMNFNGRIRRHGLLVPLMALSIVFSQCQAFSTQALSAARNQGGVHTRSFSRYSSTVDYDHHYEPLVTESSPIATPTPENAIQTRSFSTNSIINSSILFIAIVTVLYQVLSVDLGITRGWSAEEIASRIPLDNWNSYTNVLNMAPLQTKALTSATVYTIGDIIAQNKEGKDMGELDRSRVARSLLAGLIGHGPMSHVWYHVSEDFFDGVLKVHHWWDFIPKVVVDQVSYPLLIVELINCRLQNFTRIN